MANLMKWTHHPFESMENLLNEDFHLLPLVKNSADLALDMYEDKDRIVIEMNAPGINPSHISVSVEGNHLRIAGDVKEQEVKTERSYHIKQRK